MMQAVVYLGVGTFSRNRSGSVFGELTVRAGEVEFPGPGWTDFVVVVLTWWCEALSRVLAGEPDPIGVRFMDGPYVVEFGPLDNGLIHLVFVEDRLERTVSYETDTDSAVLTRSLLASVDRTLEECRDRGWWSRDEDELAAARKLVVEHFQMH